ncbi:MAG: VWA domain-containing protein, partial [Candidatus Nealsonbacteria bacterium]|nr:VWA domain-containing protein [Candidatus Nealsonbacteria bacterium]
MSKQIPFRSAVVPVAILAAAVLATCSMGAASGAEAARLDTFTHPDGTNFFALSLKPQAAAPAAAAHDVVILLDTSASQAGDFRKQAMASLRSTLAGLSPNDRVRLIAVDDHAIPMSDTFVAPGSPEMAAALKKLDARTPLGSTDMADALTAAADSFAAEGKNPRTAVYIGDGMSVGNLLGAKEFETLTSRLVDGRISVVSYAVGPRLDEQLLGALAGRTGGVVLDDGSGLAVAVRATVLWPAADFKWPAQIDAFPKMTPPLRSDRDSVVVGTYTGKGPLNVEMAVTGAGGAEKLSWTVQPGQSDDKNSYLAELVASAKVDDGLSLPIIGSASLARARQQLDVDVRSLAQLARHALNADNLDNAERLAGEALARDPHDREAAAIKRAVEKRRAGGAAPADVPFSVAAADDAGVGAVDPDDLTLIAPNDGAFVQAFSREKSLIDQIIKTEVLNAVNQARGMMGTDPERAMQDLKITLEGVKRATDLNPDIRDQLSGVIQAAIQESGRRKIELDHRQQKEHEDLAAARERRLLVENLMHKEMKIDQLMERFNSLMDEGRYELAEEAVAKEVTAEDPDNSVGILATHQARFTEAIAHNMVLRVMRQKGVVDTLMQVEMSSIPTPDEPPIVYPSAEVWQELSARRMEKYKSMDLAAKGPAEKRIAEALDSPTQLEFIETPMQDVVDYLKDYHDIEIQIDRASLDDVGIGSDTPITKNLKGISLRSALRLTLRELDLTYMIRDEVLLITTPEEAESQLTTKVYPVADLVLPISNQMMGGYGGMGGMGMGGGGGGGGGMG